MTSEFIMTVAINNYDHLYECMNGANKLGSVRWGSSRIKQGNAHSNSHDKNVTLYR